MKEIFPNCERIYKNVQELSQLTDPGLPGFTRISFSDYDRMAREHVANLMEREAGLVVKIDAAGNLIGHRKGLTDGACIVMGSHLDTVWGGGRFDGVVGVLTALEVARRLEELDIETIHPLELVVFVGEEPSSFGISCVGSRAIAGTISPELLESLRDNQGRTLSEAIKEMGGNPTGIQDAQKTPEEMLSFLEVHIEQGPILFSNDIVIGVVTGIAGIQRGEIRIVGRGDHAGTTPMNARVDALCAAGEVIVTFENTCKRRNGVVGTIGTIEISPNAPNVVPGLAILGLELRSVLKDDALQTASQFRRELHDIGQRRKIDIDFNLRTSLDPLVFKRKIVEMIANSCRQLKISFLEMPSWAGHDAGHMNEICATGMLFVPSKDGRSHCPEEWTEIEHIRIGSEVLAETVVSLDREEDSD